MSLPDEQWQAEMHRRMAVMYSLQNELQQTNSELGQQNKEMKIRLSNYEQEKAHIIANARQLAIQEVRAPFEMLLRQKTDELDHCKDMYNNVLSESDRQKAEVDRLTKEQEKLHNDGQTQLREVESLQAEVQRLTEAARQNETTTKTLSAAISQAQVDMTELNLSNANYKAQVENLTAELVLFRQGTSNQISQSEDDKKALNSRIQELTSKVEELDTELLRKEDALLAQAKNLSRMESETNKRSTLLDEAQAQLQEYASQLERINSERESANNLFDEYYEKSAEQAQLIAQQSTELDETLAKNSLLQANVETLKSQIVELKQRNQVLNSGRPAVVQVDKAIQVVPCRTDVAIQTTPEITTVSASTSTQINAQSVPPRIIRYSTRNKHYTRRPAIVVQVQDTELPAARREHIDSLPAVTIPDSARTATAVFGRTHLASVLGGGMQGVVGTFDVKKERKPLSAQHDLLGCLYPQRHLNPWLPSEPGAHGYLFLGLFGPGKDHLRFLTPTPRALFISEHSGWKYYGQYLVVRNPDKDMTLEEWNTFSDDFKDGDNGYCAMTLNKSMGGSAYKSLKDDYKANHDEKVREVRVRYDAGELRVPCISLQCIGYNEELVAGLNAQENGSISQVSLKRKRASSDSCEPADNSSPSPSRPATRSRVTIRIPGSKQSTSSPAQR